MSNKKSSSYINATALNLRANATGGGSPVGGIPGRAGGGACMRGGGKPGRPGCGAGGGG